MLSYQCISIPHSQHLWFLTIIFYYEPYNIQIYIFCLHFHYTSYL
nr:MAG TPA: hypothetical protein [Caudoviricetes sp.]